MRAGKGCVRTVLAFGLATPAGAQEVRRVPPSVDPVAELVASYLRKTSVVHPCPIEPTADIVVCGRRSERARQRLPLPELNAVPEGTRIVPGEVPRASAKPVKQGSCGVVHETKNCNRGLEVVKSKF